MEYTTVYEYTLGNNNFFHIIPLLLLTVFGFGIAIFFKKQIKKFSTFRQFLIFIGYIIGGIPLIMVVVMFFKMPSLLKEERELKEIIQEEKYKVIEGEVEDFSIREESGHIFESFKLNDVTFEYSDYIINEGFHQTSKNNGPIYKNGQRIKISYITKDNQNLILKLEMQTPN
jgi:competence protein ComGC